jgi:hypothetical protein
MGRRHWKSESPERFLRCRFIWYVVPRIGGAAGAAGAERPALSVVDVVEARSFRRVTRDAQE